MPAFYRIDLLLELEYEYFSVIFVSYYTHKARKSTKCLK